MCQDETRFENNKIAPWASISNSSRSFYDKILASNGLIDTEPTIAIKR